MDMQLMLDFVKTSFARTNNDHVPSDIVLFVLQHCHSEGRLPHDLETFTHS